MFLFAQLEVEEKYSYIVIPVITIKIKEMPPYILHIGESIDIIYISNVSHYVSGLPYYTPNISIILCKVWEVISVWKKILSVKFLCNSKFLPNIWADAIMQLLIILSLFLFLQVEKWRICKRSGNRWIYGHTLSS